MKLRMKIADFGSIPISPRGWAESRNLSRGREGEEELRYMALYEGWALVSSATHAVARRGVVRRIDLARAKFLSVDSEHDDDQVLILAESGEQILLER